MSDVVFVDTNILVYAHDADAGLKRDGSIESLRRLWEAGSGRLSVQVLQEFYVNVTRKLSSPLAVATAREVVEIYGEWIHEATTETTILRASHLAEISQISFWDALIVASAEQSGAAQLYTEDMNAGQMIAGILIVNPLI
jgi:predicted nucleic acid-binding protein